MGKVKRSLGLWPKFEFRFKFKSDENKDLEESEDDGDGQIGIKTKNERDEREKVKFSFFGSEEVNEKSNLKNSKSNRRERIKAVKGGFEEGPEKKKGDGNEET